MPLAYITGTATQGSADAFVASAVATALSGQTQRAFRVRELLFEFQAGHGANNSERSVALSRRIQTAMPNVTDQNVLAKIVTYNMFTTSGMAQVPLVHRLTFTEDDELLIVEDPIYIVLDSTSTTLTNVCNFRLGYELVNISANDRLALALSSLNE